MKDKHNKKTDFAYSGVDEAHYSGFINDAFGFVQAKQMLRSDLWERFVDQFRFDADFDGGWRCEYWGKTMRAACLIYSYSLNTDLYNILETTVKDILGTADINGRISTYAVNHEFEAWDLWGRKYVLLGMLYFLDICKDDTLKEKIINSLKLQMNYIIRYIGSEPEKKEITSATRHWRGLNSSSILEPVIKIYKLTDEKKYLDFAEYIVNSGATDVVNIFDLAYDNDFCPYQYPVTKAYEMISCFEGLLEYYRITLNDKYKTALVNFADRILETDFTVIGGCGCTNELFDHSVVRQANTTNHRIMQETCVTVTLMGFFYQMNLITGNAKYADAFERSLYNAYLGSFNTEDQIEPSLIEEDHDMIIEPLPFDSYSPLTSGTRGNGIGGFKVMSDNHYYGCCACIGGFGIGLVPKMQMLSTETGFVMNLYINGTISSVTPENQKIQFKTITEYPKSGGIEIIIDIEREEEFELLLRNPAWNEKTSCYCNGYAVDLKDGYISINKKWSKGDRIVLDMDMRTEIIRPIPYGSQILMNKVIWGHNYMIQTFDREDEQAKNHVALRRGPIMLAQENRLGYDVEDAIEIAPDKKFIDVNVNCKPEAPYLNILEALVPLANGETMLVTDYASAGKLWSEGNKMAVWMLTK